MPQQHLNLGTPNGGDGDDMRAAMAKVQANFTDLYAAPEIVKIPTDAPDPQTALNTIVSRGNRPWRLIIEDGYLLTGGLTVSGDYSHVTIESEDDEVGLAPSFPAGQGLLNVRYGKAPVWGILVNCGGLPIAGEFGALNYRECSSGLILPGKGARNGGAGSGLFVFGNSSVYADRAVLREFPVYGAWVTHQSGTYLERAQISGNGDCGLFISRGSDVYAVGAKFIGNPMGARVWRSHLVAFPHGAGPTEFVGLGDYGIGIEADHGAQIEIHERSGHSVEISNFTHGIDAAGMSRVDFQGGSLSGIVYDGIRANGAGTVVNANGTSIACGRNPVVSDDAALVSINDGSAVGAVAVAFWAKNGGQIKARRAIATGCTSPIAAAVSEFGGSVDVSGANLTGATAASIIARGGGQAIATAALARRGGADAPGDMVIERGSTIVAHGATGGTSVTPNAVTAAGVIYK